MDEAQNDDIKKQQKLSYEVLKIVGELCRKNNISYFLLAGTVLGAVRHKGFIPWDDDIDIGILLDDYEKFSELCSANLPENYFWSSPNTNRLHPRLFGKILFDGKHCMDVFPVVKTSNHLFWRKIQWMQLKVFYVAYLYKIKMKASIPSPVKKIILPMLSFPLSVLFTRKWIVKQAYRIMRRFERKKTNYYINICSRYKMPKELIKSEWVENLSPIQFETDMFPAFSDTEAYLTHLYGDYMQLPPKEQQYPDHVSQVFKIDRITK